ncbi:MAG: coiled-coil domain-containing protein [Planctomycetota bacterium]|jgi:chromosome segregation ATPase
MTDYDDQHQPTEFDAPEPPAPATDSDPTPTDGPRPDDGQPGEHVMSIMEDVERQFERLRSIQNKQADEVSALSKRSSDLDERQRDLAKREAALTAAHETLRLESETERAELESREERLAAAEEQARTTATEMEQQSAKLESRADELARHEASVAERQREIESRTERLAADQKAFELEQDQARAALRSERDAFDVLVSEAESAGEQTKAERASMDSQRAELEQATDDMERQREEMRTRHAELEQTLASIREERESLQAEREEVSVERSSFAEARSAQREELEIRERMVSESEHGAARVSELEAERDSLLIRIEEAEQTSTTLQQELSRAGGELESAVAQADHVESAAEERIAAVMKQMETLQGERQASLDKLAALEQEHARFQQTSEEQAEALREAVAAAEAASEGARQSLEQQASLAGERDAELEKARQSAGRVAELESQLEAANSKLMLTGERMAKFSGMLEQQGQLIEQGAAAMATVDHQNEEIERLRGQLAESRLAGDTNEMQRRDERIKQLTDALRQARGQSGSKEDTVELDLKVTDLSRDNDELRVELQRIQVEKDELKRQVEAQLEEVGSQAGAESAFEVKRVELEVTINDLTARLQLADDRIAELEGAVAAADSAGASGPDDQAIREKARRVAEIAAHLKRRQTRLQKLRRLVRSSATTATTAPAADTTSKGARETEVRLREERAKLMRESSEQRMRLKEVHQLLARKEKKMRRRWARPRAVATLGWIVLILVANACAAFLAADHYFPANMVSTASMRAKGAATFDAANATEWLTWHQQRLLDDSFHESLASRMRERRIEAYKTPTAAAALVANIAVDTAIPGRLTFSLETTDPDQGTLLLELVTTTLATDSRVAHAKLKSEHVAVTENAPTANKGEPRVATVGPFAVNDDRLVFGGAIFVVSSGVTLFVIISLYIRLVRSKRLFDENDELFDDPEPTVHAIA